MIRHIVFFTAKHDGNVASIREGLARPTRTPHALRLEIALNRKSDSASKEIDVVVYGEFEDDAALAAYKAHELYAEAVKLVRPLRELRFAADYDVGTALSGAQNDGGG
jgi:quinol monooxygenase YgiN